MNNQSTASKVAQLWANKDLTKQAGIDAADAYGTAKFLEHEELEKLGLYNGPIVLGRSDENKLIRYGGDSHLCTLAPNGAGKSVASVVVNTLEYPGSLCVIDPKGAIAPVCARARLERGRVWIFDPFHEVKAPDLQALRVSYNPLSSLHPESPTLIDEARRISESIVQGETGDNSYFSDIARSVCEAFMLYALANGQADIDTVLSLAFASPKTFAEDTLPEMQDSPAFDGLLSQLANQIAGLSGNGGEAIWSTLRRSLNVFQSPLIRAALQPSDVDFSRMKEEVITVFLVLPATRLSRYGRYLRLMISMMIAALLDPRKPKTGPVLFLIDEASALGNLSMLSDGISLFRGYSIKLWLYWQSLDQLQSTYPEKWQTFLANSVKQVFGVNDFNGAKYFSDYLGNRSQQVSSQSVAGDSIGGGSNISHIQRALMAPDEVMRLAPDRELLLLEGQFPIRAKKLRYWADAEFQGRFDADPYQTGGK